MANRHGGTIPSRCMDFSTSNPDSGFLNLLKMLVF